MYIRVNKCSSNYILLLIVPIFSSLPFFTSVLLNSNKHNFDVENHPFIRYLIQSIIGMLSGLPLLFNQSKRLKQIQRKETIQNNIRASLAKTQTNLMPSTFQSSIIIKSNSQIKQILLMTLIVIFDLIPEIIILVSVLDENGYQLLNQFTLLEIIFTGLLSYPILHFPLYKHHFLSIGILLVGFSFISFQNILFLSKSNWFALLSIFVCFVFWSLNLVYGKYMLLIMKWNPFKLCFLYHMILLCLSIFLIIISMYIPCNQVYCHEEVVEPFVTSIQMIFSSGSLILFFFLSAIFNALYNLVIIITNDKLTPTHVSMAEILTNVILWIYYTVESIEIKYTFPYSVVGYIIIIIGALIYNELIVLAFCSLDQYIKSEIASRSTKEYFEMRRIIDNIDELQNDNVYVF